MATQNVRGIFRLRIRALLVFVRFIGFSEGLPAGMGDAKTMVTANGTASETNINIVLRT